MTGSTAIKRDVCERQGTGRQGTRRLVATLLVSLGLAAAALAGTTPALADGEDTTFRVYWKEGIRMDTADGQFKLKVGGRIQNDWAFYSVDDELEAATGEFDDGTEIRRGRLYVSGTIYDQVVFKAQYDFAGGDADFKDVYLGLKKLPGLGTLRIGHFKEPFSLQQLTSSKYNTFLERGLPDAFALGRNIGIGFQNSCAEDRVTYAAGFFRETDDFATTDDEAFGVTARVTGLPWWQGDDRFLHVGFGYSHRDTDDAEIGFDARPESHMAEKVVDTGDLMIDTYGVYGGELALVHGPFSVQGEYTLVETDMNSSGGLEAVGDSGDPSFSGWYVFASYWLTGEHRAYKPAQGAFSRVKPNSNFLKDGGTGGVEIAARYSHLDLNDSFVEGGEASDITVGVNWHLNPNTRVMLNYTRADVDDHPELEASAEADIVQMRFQIDF